MNDIAVKVEQTPGVIKWNYEEIKKNLEAELETYKNTAYTDDTIGTAKKDVAALRSLSKDINDRKIEVKNACLEPYQIIEDQAKELIALIEEPISVINAQVKDYEERRKKAVHEKIDAHFSSEYEKAGLPANLRDMAYGKIFDSKWLNATCSMKTWKDGITNGLKAIGKDIESIKSFNSEFEDDMMKSYSAKLELSDAISKMKQMDEQKQRILEAERRKKEEAERLERERAEREARERAEAEKRAAEEAAAKSAAPAENDADRPVEAAEPHEDVKAQGEAENIIPSVESDRAPVQEDNADAGQPAEPVNVFAQPAPEYVTETLMITGTKAQLDKIKSFITYAGATWKGGE